MNRNRDAPRPWGHAVAVGLFAAPAAALAAATTMLVALPTVSWVHGTVDGLDHVMTRADGHGHA
ncbi:hypothetical protein psal_cds_675 [Pandoravirus salinus]|uniref:Uncharacterized protein n=1 Tax=Pandoravirus salinus TaxID=1349410 RepID=S4W304_9VIRU|nr:hypothetical protein psal_cds_675 [Pandoravirus salinus]AGO84605.1 hypothetical protein psal_cds_675 [Pandoravirus salinus]